MFWVSLKKGISFPCVSPQLSGRILFAPPDARVTFLHNDLLCNGMRSVTGGRKTYLLGGGTNRSLQQKFTEIGSVES